MCPRKINNSEGLCESIQATSSPTPNSIPPALGFVIPLYSLLIFKDDLVRLLLRVQKHSLWVKISQVWHNSKTLIFFSCSCLTHYLFSSMIMILLMFYFLPICSLYLKKEIMILSDKLGDINVISLVMENFCYCMRQGRQCFSTNWEHLWQVSTLILYALVSN